MRNELEKLLAEHGSYWIVALFSVGVSKLYAREDQTLRTVIRSLLAAALYSYLFVEFSRNRIDAWAVIASVAAGSFIIDGMVEALVMFQAKIKKDPTIILKFIPYLNKGGKK